jgi:DNA modification methylase
MTPEEFAALKADIKSNGGIRNRIVILNGKIIDGRHRYRALIELGMFDPDKHTAEYKQSWGDPWNWVVSQMQHRSRSPSIKAVEAELMMDQIPAERGEGKRADIVAELFGIAARNIEIVRSIRKSAPKLYAEMRSGAININQAYNRSRQKARAKTVRKLREESSTTMADFDLRVGDAVELLAKVPGNSVKVIFVDPPYNLGLAYDGDPTGDKLTDDKFYDWCALWLNHLVRILSDDGSLFIMMPHRHAWFLHSELVRGHELHYRNTIAWYETFGNHTESNLTDCWRPILYFTKQAEGFTWNTDVRIESDRQAKYGDTRANPDGKTPTNVWQISRVQGTANERVPFDDAPPQLPTEIPARCILLASNPGDVVLDCFNGNGTTALAAIANGRRYVGMERSAKYAKQSRQWVASQLESIGGR